MKLLVDQNLSLSLVDQLASAGHEANHTTTVGLASASDPAIFEWCRENDAVLVTADKKLTIPWPLVHPDEPDDARTRSGTGRRSGTR